MLSSTNSSFETEKFENENQQFEEKKFNNFEDFRSKVKFLLFLFVCTATAISMGDSEASEVSKKLEKRFQEKKF